MYLVTSPPHLDDWTLLRLVVNDLPVAEHERTQLHLKGCLRCTRGLNQIAELDRELREIAAEAPWDQLDERDPFARRPERWEPPLRLPPHQAEVRAAQALAASERGEALAVTLLNVGGAPGKDLNSVLSAMPLSDPANRFGLLYMLETAGHLIAENPTASAVLADEILHRLSREEAGRGEADWLVPLALVMGHAHLLAGQCGNWTGDYDKAGRHLADAYRLIGEATGDPFNLAQVEYSESQRRSFSGQPSEALALARRARKTFDALNLEDYAARARAAEGNARFFLGSYEESLEDFRAALAVFERLKLWSNYVGVVNGIAECLLKIGQLEQVRRQYANALRRLSREREPVWVAYIRHGLANAMFAGGRYREAAAAFGRVAGVNRDLGLLANALTAALFEVESWARAGNPGRAAHRFELWRQETARNGGIDPSLARSLEKALLAADLAAVATLRQEAEGMLRERLKEKRIS